jgi:hypothetical protein
MEVLWQNGGKWFALKVEMTLGLQTLHLLPVAILQSSRMLCALHVMASFLVSALLLRLAW